MSAILGQLLTPQEVAIWLSISTRDVLRMTRRGELPCLHLPDGEPRYDPAELNVWLRRRPTTRPEDRR
jgi:hypothetical protein